MILNHVADRTNPIVERASPLDSKVFRHGDLHTFDMAAIPKRLQQRVGEPEEQHIVHRPLTQIMVDAEDATLIERAEEDLVEFLGRDEVTAEGLFNNHPRTLGTARFRQLLDDQSEQNRRYGEI